MRYNRILLRQMNLLLSERKHSIVSSAFLIEKEISLQIESCFSYLFFLVNSEQLIFFFFCVYYCDEEI